MTTQTLERIEVHTRVAEKKINDSQIPLCDAVKHALLQYFDELEGEEPGNLYDMVIRQVEAPLLEIVMEQVGGNQTRAAACLGLNRGTLRKKLRAYDLDR